MLSAAASAADLATAKLAEPEQYFLMLGTLDRQSHKCCVVVDQSRASGVRCAVVSSRSQGGGAAANARLHVVVLGALVRPAARDRAAVCRVR